MQRFVFLQVLSFLSDSMIGDVNLFFNDQNDINHAELEVMIAESSQRQKGKGKTAVCLMIRYGIEVLHVTSFSAKIKTSNTVSQRLFENLGFILVRQILPGYFDSIRVRISKSLKQMHGTLKTKSSLTYAKLGMAIMSF